MATQTFNFPSQTYSAGQHIVGPFTMPTGVDTLLVNFTLSQTDLADPAETLDYEMDVSPDGGTTWNFDNGFSGWTGGITNPKNGQLVQPVIGVNGLSSLVGKLCRIVITTTKAMTTAISVQVS